METQNKTTPTLSNQTDASIFFKDNERMKFIESDDFTMPVYSIQNVHDGAVSYNIAPITDNKLLRSFVSQHNDTNIALLDTLKRLRVYKRIDVEDLQQFILVDDYDPLYDIREKRNQSHEMYAEFKQSFAFYVKEYDFYIAVDADWQTTKNDDDEDTSHYEWTLTYIFVNIERKGLFERVSNFYKKYLTCVPEEQDQNDPSIYVLLEGRNGMIMHNRTINPKPINTDTMYNDGFTEISDKLVAQLNTKNKGITILHGLPGTGKTNYIKWLTGQVNARFLFIPNTLISNLDKPAFITLLVQNPVDVIVIEDCENYIRSRDDSANNVISTLLNISDGILSDILECQFICTFNTQISNIDSALLRKGRLNGEYYFDNLSVDKANALLKELGSSYVTDQPMSLAEVTNIDDAVVRSEPKTKTRSIGFVKQDRSEVSSW